MITRLLQTLIAISVAYGSMAHAQSARSINYFDCDPPPADRPVVFAPGLISLENRYEEKIGFTSDGTEVFFGTHPDPKNYFKPVLMHAHYADGKWSTPAPSELTHGEPVGWPLLSYAPTTLFMEKVAGKTQKGVIGQILFSRRNEQGQWTTPQAIEPDVPSKEGFGLAQITRDGHFYFHDRFGRIAYVSKLADGKVQNPKALPFRINPAVEFFVSPDNDYIIFGPLNWNNCLHVSFREGDNQWSMPIAFNRFFRKPSEWNGHGAGPSVSPDGKYFFFAKGGDIYWVKADFIDALRKMD